MSNGTALVETLRSRAGMIGVAAADALRMFDAADLIETQASEITELRAQLVSSKKREARERE